MTIEEAEKIVDEYEFKSVTTPDEDFMLTEAMEFLIDKTKDTKWMVRLGGYYYDRKDFDLALKYYEMADSFGDRWAPEGLGYIWYYGRTGEKDYGKAFHYYEKAAVYGSLNSAMKIADMYKNGYYVEKDYDKYVEMIENLYTQTKHHRNCGEKVGIFVRLARIRKEQGDSDDPKPVLGPIDFAGRSKMKHFIPNDYMNVSMPWELFLKLEELSKNSVLQTDLWKKFKD